MTALTHRIATIDDAPAIAALMERAIDSLQRAFLSPKEVAASRLSMGLDTQLIADGTYFVIEQDAALAGCGGWSRRATLYGGSHSAGLRDDRLLDPAREPARIRAMYTDPAFVRRGIGRLVLSLAEEAARAVGFGRAELMATLAGNRCIWRAGIGRSSGWRRCRPRARRCRGCGWGRICSAIVFPFVLSLSKHMSKMCRGVPNTPFDKLRANGNPMRLRSAEQPLHRAFEHH